MARRKPLHSGSGVHVPDGMGGYLGNKSIGMATRIQIADVHLQAMSDTRHRMSLAAAAFFFAFVTLSIKLVGVTFSTPENARNSFTSASSVVRVRGNILDRNGEILATNLLSSSLYADLNEVWNPEHTAKELKRKIQSLDESKILRRLKLERRYVQLLRHLTPMEKQAVFTLGLPGLEFPRQERRYYPRGSDAAHIIGYVDADNNGISGVELSLNEEIMAAGQNGRPIVLSLDMRIQHVLQDELAKAMEKFEAKGAAGVVLDVTSGEVVALVSLPHFNPNDPMAAPARHRFNQVTKGLYEMGSVFKMFTLAMALESGSVELTDGYDTSKPLRIARYTINDFHGENRWLTVPEIFVYSSNIGSVKIARDVGITYHRDFLRKLGLFDRSPIELPEVGIPNIPNEWREIRAATIAYGHGIAISPLQLATAAAALVNGGVLYKPTIIRREGLDPTEAKQVISPVTSRKMRSLLRMVVTDGTGRKADVVGYDVGGKTGTAEKSHAGGYSRNTLLTSFVATFPTQDPRYVVFVMLDEPHVTPDTYGFVTAGWTAAPVAGGVIKRSGPILGIVPVRENPAGLQQAMLSVP